MLTVGEGGMSPLEETTQMAIYAVLGCPLVLGCNVLDMSSATLSIVRLSRFLFPYFNVLVFL